MIPDEQINRLGFEAWADNVITDALESTFMEAIGHVYYEKPDMCVNITLEENCVTAVLRAYTSEGWKEHSRTIKR